MLLVSDPAAPSVRGGRQEIVLMKVGMEFRAILPSPGLPNQTRVGEDPARRLPRLVAKLAQNERFRESVFVVIFLVDTQPSDSYTLDSNALDG